jgi:hypothetical protein
LRQNRARLSVLEAGQSTKAARWEGRPPFRASNLKNE